jgi:hypothetical protein
VDVPSVNISEQSEHGRSTSDGRFDGGGRYSYSQFHIRHFMQFSLLVLAAHLCCFALWAQTPDSQTDDANKSWTATTESKDANSDPVLTLESHTENGNRTLDTQSIQRGSDGHFEPYQDIEKETVQMDAATVRTTTRTFNRDADGVKTLVQVIEEEKHTLAGGNSTVVRSTSNPDSNGDLQLIKRQVEETTKVSPNVEETKTTVMLPSVNGGLVPAVKVQERREQDPSGALEAQKTTLLPDGGGTWQVGEIRHTTTRQEGKDRITTEERVSVPDSEGRLGEISHTVSEEVDSVAGDRRNTMETYSVDVPGAVPDGGLHLVERAITIQHTSATGQQATEQQVEQRDPGNPGSGLRVSIVTTDAVRPDTSGAQATRTIQARDANGNLEVITVDTSKSDNIHAIQVQIAPSDKPK